MTAKQLRDWLEMFENTTEVVVVRDGRTQPIKGVAMGNPMTLPGESPKWGTALLLLDRPLR